MSRANVKTVNFDRDYCCDFIRSIAIMLVIEIHVFEASYDSASRISSDLFPIFYSLGRFGVPLFFILTGYFVLSKRFISSGSVSRFYKKSLLSLLSTILIWSVIYNVYYWLFFDTPLLTCFTWLVFFNNNPAGNWWFVPAIISLYIALPFVSRSLEGLSVKALVVPTILVSIWGFGLPSLNLLNAYIGNGLEFSSSINSDYIFGAYGFYLIIGYFFHRIKLQTIADNINYIVICLIVFCLSLFLCSQCAMRNITLWYNHLPVLLGGTSLFILLYKFGTLLLNCFDKLKSIFLWISKVSFAAYFLHYLLIMTWSYYKLIPGPGLSNVSVTLFLTFFITFGLLTFGWVITTKTLWIRKLIYHCK